MKKKNKLLVIVCSILLLIPLISLPIFAFGIDEDYNANLFYNTLNLSQLSIYDWEKDFSYEYDFPTFIYNSDQDYSSAKYEWIYDYSVGEWRTRWFGYQMSYETYGIQKSVYDVKYSVENQATSTYTLASNDGFIFSSKRVNDGVDDLDYYEFSQELIISAPFGVIDINPYVSCGIQAVKYFDYGYELVDYGTVVFPMVEGYSSATVEYYQLRDALDFEIRKKLSGDNSFYVGDYDVLITDFACSFEVNDYQGDINIWVDAEDTYKGAKYFYDIYAITSTPTDENISFLQIAIASVADILSVEIFRGFSIGGLLSLIVAIPLFIFFLKLIAGG